MSGYKVKVDYKPDLLPGDRKVPIFKHFKVSSMTLLSMGTAFFLSVQFMSVGSKITLPQKAPKTHVHPVAIPQQITSLPLQPSPALTISEAPQAPSSNWLTLLIKPGDNLANLLSTVGLKNQQLQEILRIGHHAKYLEKIYPGQVIKLNISASGELLNFIKNLDPFRTLHIQRQHDGQLGSFIQKAPKTTQVAYGSAVIQDSLYLAGKKAGLDDALLMELANIFGYDIDFALDIKPNDRFQVLFEEHYAQDKKVGSGHILAAQFVTNRKIYEAIRYEDEFGNVGYFTPTGHSLKKAFIRTPVQYTRISSHFNLKRKHPILHKIRAHRGVDYAAPRGTPVKASGNGIIEFIGTKGGYGKTIVLKHGQQYTTLYGHLSRFSPNLKKNSRVEQGQVIGFVGSTGLASGPHLHYEFRINGVHRDPLKVALPKALQIPQSQKVPFKLHAQSMLDLLGQHEEVTIAANEI